MNNRAAVVFLLVFLPSFLWAQFSVDLISCQYQTGNTGGHKIQNGFINVMVPIQLKSGHVFITRVAYENLRTSTDSLAGTVQNLAVPIGFNWKLSETNRLTTLLIPKLSGEGLAVGQSNTQLGFYGFFQHQKSQDFRYRIGVYYNREFFGNFFVPLVGIDWRISPQVSLFGTLPNSMKLMFTTTDGNYAVGIAFRSLMRSYRLNLSDPSAFVRFNENQLKLINEIKVSDHWVVQADAGLFVTQAPLLYKYGYRKELLSSDLYTKLKPFPMLNIGLVYRISSN